MYLGGFSEYVVVPAQQAVRVPAGIPADRACLLGCAVMTGFGGATHIARIEWGATVMVIGTGAVGLAAVQGARLAGAGRIIAVDLNPARRAMAERAGAGVLCDPKAEDPAALAKSLTAGRGADVVIEAAGVPAGFRTSVEAARPGGQVVWLGKVGRAGGCGLPLGRADAGEAHHPQQLWRGTAGGGFPSHGAGLSGWKAGPRQPDHRPHITGAD